MAIDVEKRQGMRITSDLSGRSMKTSERVARAIVETILDDGLEPGDALPSEAALIKQHDVARSSVREALRILEIQGLVVIRPGNGGGTTVGTVDPRHYGRMSALYFQSMRATFDELMEARLTIEPVMAGLAARRQDSEQLARLREILDRTHEVPLAEAQTHLHLAGEFHRAVAGASGNRILDLVGEALKDLYSERMPERSNPVEGRTQSAHDHDAIALAILSGHARKAERLMREHMEEYVDFVKRTQPMMMTAVVGWM